jgi:hypothetical protein
MNDLTPTAKETVAEGRLVPTDDQGPLLPGQRPLSAVSAKSCWVGFLGLCAGLYLMWRAQWPLGTATLCILATTAIPMLLWQGFVEKVYRRPSAELDFSQPRPLRESLRDTGIKLIGLWTTWFVILLIYWSIRWYTDAGGQFYFTVLKIFGPWVFLLSIPYVFLVDRYSRAPHDALWQAGAWIIGDRASTEPSVLWDYVRAWGVKAFFLAFTMGIAPYSVSAVLTRLNPATFSDPTAFFSWFIEFIFLFDVTFGTIGYILTLKLMDSHIRSANPYTAGWAAALVCYPPFNLGIAGVLSYTINGHEWAYWFQGHPLLLIIWGCLLIGLSGIYAWATVIFGIRFSNLTNRGIITNGPYRFFKHPAYLFKNTYWWLCYLPFLSSASIGESIRNSLLLLIGNGIYYMRARTEERHLMADPAYQAYSAWIAEHGVLPRIKRLLLRKTAGVAAAKLRSG